MSRPMDELRAARPDDPNAADTAQATERILARVHMRIRSDRGRRRRWGWRVAAVAALAVGAGLAIRAANDRADAPAAIEIAEGRARPVELQPVESQPVGHDKPTLRVPSAYFPFVARAVAGESVARSRLRDGGRVALEAILRAAEDETFADRPAALALLRVVGPLQGERAIGRVAALVKDPQVREAAVTVLSRSVGSQGVRALGDALVAYPDAEADVLLGLGHVVHGGRRSLALESLLRGVEAGRAQTLLVALDVAGPMGLPGVLEVMPADRAQVPAVAAGVRQQSDLIRTRLVRLAARGSHNALRLVGEAQLPEAVAVLAGAALGDEEPLALAAVAWLQRQNSVAGDVALGRTVDAEGPAGEAARDALQERSAARLEQLAARVRRSHRDRLAALRALSVAPEGIAHIERLAHHRRLFEAARTELTLARVPEASHALARLGNERQRFDPVLQALLARLHADRAGAAVGLVALARESNAARAVFQELMQPTHRERGEAVLEAAAADPHLAPHVDDVRRGHVVRRERVGPRRRLPGVARATARHGRGI